MPSAGAGHPQGHSCMVPCGGGKPQQGPARGRKLLGTACGGSRAAAASQLDKEIRPVPGYCISAHIQISSSQNCLLSPLRLCPFHLSQPARLVFCFIFPFVTLTSLFRLVSVHFSLPCLVSGKRRRRRKKSNQSRSPIQRKRERMMPPVRARTGTEPGHSWAPTNSPRFLPNR